jgi:CRISPR-associated endoribonuclease Cas6
MLLQRTAPELAARLHDTGYGLHRMVPFGYSAPMFPAARRRPRVYAAGGPGIVELGSPLPEVVLAWAEALRDMPVIAWGPVAFIVDSIEAVDPPEFAAGVATFRTSTPVVMKSSGLSPSGTRTTRQAWCLPGEPEWDVYMQGNLRRKAETLSLDPDVTLESVNWVGAKRSFVVAASDGSGGKKPGACVEVRVSGSPETLRAIHSWGLGQANSTGMGWISG